MFWTSGVLRSSPPRKSVAVAPGATVLTVICRGPSSFARYRVRTSTAPLHAA